MRKKEIKELYRLDCEAGANGKLIEKAVYIGENISFGSKKYTKRKVTLRLVFGAFVLLGLMILAGVLNTATSRYMLIGVPFVFVFLPIIYLFRGIYALLEHKEPLTKVTYTHSILRSRRSYIGTFVLNAYIFLGSTLYFLLNFSKDNWKEELFFVILNITALLFSYFQIQYVSRVQKTMVFEEQTVDIEKEPESLV